MNKLITAICLLIISNTIQITQLLCSDVSAKSLVNGNVTRIETLKVKDQSIILIRDTVKVEVHLEKDSVYKAQEKTSTEWLLLILPIIIASISLFIAYYVFKTSKRHKSYDFLFDLNKMMVNNPELWYIYDIHKKYLKTDELKNFEHKLFSICYYILNNYDLIYSNTPKISKMLFFSKSNSFKVWNKYIIHLIAGSIEFRFILRDVIDSEIYTKSYKKHLEKLINKTKYKRHTVPNGFKTLVQEK